MRKVNGLNDIYTIIQNERKLGSAIEAESIRLRSGEEFAGIPKFLGVLFDVYPIHFLRPTFRINILYIVLIKYSPLSSGASSFFKINPQLL
ncbi:hypothetical protein [Bacillus sp. EB600]|uniref:hypothetical protein n=1 Tax=Bacillus sp. EB600 TaxID=2806345 RepID=UPI00210CE5D1|nr:hypothetical protein [Bacillus sp. EB600]MCQ6281962.1 hypothetical protein [Bacillus sp. EB600]